MRSWLPLVLLGVCAAMPVAAQTQPGSHLPVTDTGTGKEAWQAPTLTTTRYDEHWDLADPAARSGHWTEPFKYVSIGDDAYLTIGIEVRARVESYRNNLWGGAPYPDDDYLWVRAMPYVDLHLERGAIGVRGFVQPIAAYAIGVAPAAGPIDQTRTDLLQGFADVRLGVETGSTQGFGVTLRAGRQMLSLGTQRLVGNRYGPNVPLVFDGVRALVSLPGASVSMIAARPVQAATGSFDDDGSRTRKLDGVYATLPAIGLSSGLDVYWLGYRNAVARFGGHSGAEDRDSFGTRVFGESAGWSWNVEAVYQRGRFAGNRISAWTLGSEVGRRFAHLLFAPVAMLRVNIVSGDGRQDDGRLGTFNAMFPRGKYFGELSPIGPYNIVSVNPQVALTLGDKVSVGLAGMAYWRYSAEDGIYDVPGNLIRAPGDATARYIGKQAEATLAWQATPELELSTSISAFDPGSFIRQTGRARTIAMLGLETNFRF